MSKFGVDTQNTERHYVESLVGNYQIYITRGKFPGERLIKSKMIKALYEFLQDLYDPPPRRILIAIGDDVITSTIKFKGIKNRWIIAWKLQSSWESITKRLNPKTRLVDKDTTNAVEAEVKRRLGYDPTKEE